MARELRGILTSFVEAESARQAIHDSGSPLLIPHTSVVLANYPDDRADEDESEIEQGKAAIHALMFATIAENNRHNSHSNGATFEHEVHYESGRWGPVSVQRRMEGFIFRPFDPSRTLRVKPWHVGAFHAGADPAFMDALMAWRDSDHDHVDELFRTLRTATSDSPDLERPLALALYAKAVALAASSPGDDDDARAMRPRLKSLLAPLLGPETTGDEYGYHIVRAWDATRDARNSAVHINKRRNERFDFQRSAASAEFAAFRTVYAVTVARLVRDGHLRESGWLAQDVLATERWLAALGPADSKISDATNWSKERRRTREMHLRRKYLSRRVSPVSDAAS